MLSSTLRDFAELFSHTQCWCASSCRLTLLALRSRNLLLSWHARAIAPENLNPGWIQGQDNILFEKWRLLSRKCLHVSLVTSCKCWADNFFYYFMSVSASDNFSTLQDSAELCVTVGVLVQALNYLPLALKYAKFMVSWHGRATASDWHKFLFLFLGKEYFLLILDLSFL